MIFPTSTWIQKVRDLRLKKQVRTVPSTKIMKAEEHGKWSFVYQKIECYQWPMSPDYQTSRSQRIVSGNVIIHEAWSVVDDFESDSQRPRWSQLLAHRVKFDSLGDYIQKAGCIRVRHGNYLEWERFFRRFNVQRSASCIPQTLQSLRHNINLSNGSGSSANLYRSSLLHREIGPLLSSERRTSNIHVVITL